MLARERAPVAADVRSTTPLAPRPPRAVTRLWHRLLAAGTDDVAELRGWDRLITWRAHATPRARLAAIKALLKLPARAARQAYRDVARFGDEVVAQAGVPRTRQLAQLWWLAVRYGLDARAYRKYRLYRPDRWGRAGKYVGEYEFVRVVQVIKACRSGRDVDVLLDKRQFDVWCRAHGFPTVPMIMELEHGRVTHTSGLGDSLPPCDLFAKPSDGEGGYGARRWRYVRGEYVDDVAGRAMRPAEVLEELRAASFVESTSGVPRRILVQQCLRNHHALATLTPGGLCTMRLQTYRWPAHQSRPLLGIYKMPVGSALVDNFHFGGIVAPVDLETGRLQGALYRSGQLFTGIERHPDTGAVIAGHAVPFWEDAVRLVLRAHDAVPRLATVGWDVAILEEGPVLVEGNTVPNPGLAQLASGTPLGETPLVPCLNAYLRDILLPSNERSARGNRPPGPLR